MQSCNQAGDCDVVFSYPMYRDLEKSQTVLSGLVAHRGFGVNLSFKGEPITGDGMFVSGSYFPTLGLTPAAGRLLGPSDDETIGSNYVTVLSYSYWQAHFGADRGVIGQTLTVNGQSLEIVGVAPKGFEGTTLGTRPLVFVPSPCAGGVVRTRQLRQSPLVLGLPLRAAQAGVTLEKAKSALNGISSHHHRRRSTASGTDERCHNGEVQGQEIGVAAGPMGQSSIHKEARTPLLMLFGITAIVLIIACANIANLLLARGAGRAMEMGFRLALGSTRRQLLLQLLTESVLLAFMGGIASLIIAQWTLSLIASLLPPEAIATLRFELQPPVILFTAAVSLVTGILFGLFPALHSTALTW
jgi:ABC-type antimicrobial peptide transport system permease subunit